MTFSSGPNDILFCVCPPPLPHPPTHLGLEVHNGLARVEDGALVRYIQTQLLERGYHGEGLLRDDFTRDRGRYHKVMSRGFITAFSKRSHLFQGVGFGHHGGLDAGGVIPGCGTAPTRLVQQRQALVELDLISA